MISPVTGARPHLPTHLQGAPYDYPQERCPLFKIQGQKPHKALSAFTVSLLWENQEAVVIPKIDTRRWLARPSASWKQETPTGLDLRSLVLSELSGDPWAVSANPGLRITPRQNRGKQLPLLKGPQMTSAPSPSEMDQWQAVECGATVQGSKGGSEPAAAHQAPPMAHSLHSRSS